MVVRDRVAQQAETGGEVVELAVMVGEVGCDVLELAIMVREVRRNAVKLAVEGVEPAIVPRYRAGDLGEQLINGCDIRAVDAAHAIPRTILARPLLYTHFSPHQRKRLSPSRRAANGNIVPSEREKSPCFRA